MNETTSSTEDQSARRARMLDKVRKLLAMGRDERGNENEAEAAMRQANKLMAEFGIAEADVDMASLDSGAMIFGESECAPDGRAPEPGRVYRQMPSWAGVLAVGVGRFCDSIVGRKRGPNGEMLTFRGEKQDVLLARWMFGVLVQSINTEQRASGWTGKSEATSFRLAAASALQSRLRSLASERREMYRQAEASGSRALMVVDRKAAEVEQRFGTQKTRNTRGGYSNYGAASAGGEAGRRINIPSGRPISGSGRAAIR